MLQINSNPYFVTIIIKLKLKKVTKASKQSQDKKHHDVGKEYTKTNRGLSNKLRKRFHGMANPAEDPENNNNWDTIKKLYVQPATTALGCRWRKNKRGLTPDTRTNGKKLRLGNYASDDLVFGANPTSLQGKGETSKRRRRRRGQVLVESNTQSLMFHLGRRELQRTVSLFSVVWMQRESCCSCEILISWQTS